MGALKLVAVLGVAASAAAAETPKEKAAFRYAVELSIGARTFGACEQHLPTEDAARTLSAMFAADKASPNDRELRAVFAQSYAKGKREAKDWSAADCAEGLEGASKRIREAKKALESR